MISLPLVRTVERLERGAMSITLRQARKACGVALAATLVLGWSGWACAGPQPNETRSIDGYQVDLWLPPTGAGPFPLVLFSHGVAGCRNQSVYLMAALAEAGMIVAAPDHADEGCGKQLSIQSLPAIFWTPHKWSDATYQERRDQLRALRDALISDPGLGAKIDRARLALVGHSLGGYTVLAMAGARPDPLLPELKAVVALAPYLLAYAEGGTPGKITVPVLIEAGLKDRASINLPTFFSAIGGPACSQVFRDATHFAWVDSTDLPAEDHQAEYQGATAAAAVGFITQALANGTAQAPAASTPTAVVDCH